MERIESERLYLRPFGHGDAEAVWAYRSLAEVARYQYWEPYTPEDARSFNNDYIVEPSVGELIAELLPKVLSQKIFTVLLDSNTSEHAARMLAMQTATDNANELIQDLTKQYNKSRQQAITNELLDIIGGSLK